MSVVSLNVNGKLEERCGSSISYQTYPRRWLILIVVALLNMSNGAIWIGYFPVASKTATYFEKTSAAINWFSFVFMIIPFLCFFITTYLSNKKGLKFLIYVGSGFNCGGALIRALGTSGVLTENKNTQFIICLVGQTIAAVAQTFSIYIPTKVSHIWFPKHERGISTSILSLSYSAGITITQLVTPYIVNSSEDIPRLNYICFGIAGSVQILVFLIVTRSRPKIPPSETAGKEQDPNHTYLIQLKETFSSTSFVVLLVTMSCGVGIIAALNTLTQQIICIFGYTDEFAGLCIVFMYGSGYIAAAAIQPFIKRTGKYEELGKIAMAIAIISYILINEMMLHPNRKVLLGLSYAFFGISTTGMFPLWLELSVECTYPVDEAITTGLIYFFGQLFAIIVISVTSALAREAPNDEYNVCGLTSDQASLDYSISNSVNMVLVFIMFMGGISFFKPVFKRQDYEKREKKQNLEQ